MIGQFTSRPMVDTRFRDVYWHAQDLERTIDETNEYQFKFKGVDSPKRVRNITRLRTQLNQILFVGRYALQSFFVHEVCHNGWGG